MKKSFTLVELMIVIAILAILSAIVIFTLNPSELFRKTRDSRRLTDIQALYKAITFMETGNPNGINYGTSTVVYLSLPDSSTTCSSYALPTLPTGFTYNCVTSSNLRNINGTGGVPVNFTVSNSNSYLTVLPIDPVNTIEYYYSYNPGGSFEVNTFFETNEYILKYSQNDNGDSSNAYELGSSLTSMPSVFPHNGIKVPGNSLYNTSDFGVMQYEAKYATAGRTGSDALDVCKVISLHDTGHWNKTSGGCSVIGNNQNVVSSPLGSPIANISHAQAKVVCESMGARLINNHEWMTIARNVEQQDSNGTSGTVGTGYLFNGNSGNATRGYSGPAPDKGLNRNARASLVFSNGNRIYDFAGNVWQHVMVDSNDSLLNNLPHDGGVGGGREHELSSLIVSGDFSSLNQIQPSNSAGNRNQGMGSVYSNSDVQLNRVVRRGGSFGSSSYAGIFTADLSGDIAGASSSVGFRCVR